MGALSAVLHRPRAPFLKPAQLTAVAKFKAVRRPRYREGEHRLRCKQRGEMALTRRHRRMGPARGPFKLARKFASGFTFQLHDRQVAPKVGEASHLGVPE